MRPAQLTGSRAHALLQITEYALNDVLARSVASVSSGSLEVLPDNVVLVRYGVFHARATLPHTVAPRGAPRLTLTLASIVVAMALKSLLRQPFIHVHGRYLTIELAAIPALSTLSDVWRHVEELTFATVPGALRVGVTIAVTADDSATRPIPVDDRTTATTQGHHMREWFEEQLAAGFPAFAGSSMAGTVVLKQELVNEVLAKWLAETALRRDARPNVEIGRSLKFIQSAAIRAEPGVVLVDFTIAV